jgi:hypothetical protein
MKPLALVALLAPAAAFAGPRVVVPTPVEQFGVAEAGAISHVIYLERCRGGCTVTKSNTNDALAGLSSVPQTPGVHTIAEFRSKDGMIGAPADPEWEQLMQCVREVYSPFDVTVTDVKPTEGTYHLAIVAGFPAELGFGEDILGVAPLANNCAAQDNVMSFSFANAHPPQLRINNLCWTVAQESAHAFGLDHTFKFTDGRSTCNDPMTYQVDCGGQRFFRNFPAKCGEFNERTCRCGSTQNSHARLVSVFGAGTPITGAPTADIFVPNAGDPLGAFVSAHVGSKRGITRVELYVNGFPWIEQPGIAFTPIGQPNPGVYQFNLPANLPDGISDFSVRAYDDLGGVADSPVVTRTKGAPCVTADTCAQGQKCTAGKCAWDPPTAEAGDACEYAAQCTSFLCVGDAEKICSQRCNPSDKSTCPSDLECVETGPEMGLCFTPSGGGCCSASNGRVPWLQIAGSAVILGLVMRRRRRR